MKNLGAQMKDQKLSKAKLKTCPLLLLQKCHALKHYNCNKVNVTELLAFYLNSHFQITQGNYLIPTAFI